MCLCVARAYHLPRYPSAHVGAHTILAPRSGAPADKEAPAGGRQALGKMGSATIGGAMGGAMGGATGGQTVRQAARRAAARWQRRRRRHGGSSSTYPPPSPPAARAAPWVSGTERPSPAAAPPAATLQARSVCCTGVRSPCVRMCLRACLRARVCSRCSCVCQLVFVVAHDL